MYENKTREELLEEISNLKEELEKKKNEDIIENNITVFKALFDYTKDLIFILDANLKYRYTNPYLLKLFGIKEKDVIGKSNSEVMSPEKAALFDAEDKKVLKGQISRKEETGIIDERERTFYLVRSPMLNKKKELIGICGIAREITEMEKTLQALHESQQKLLGILQSTNVGINIIDLEGRFLFVNKALVNMLGYSSEEYQNIKLDHLTYDQDLKESITNIYQVLDGEVDNYEFDQRYKRKDGSVFWANLSMAPIHNQNGDIEALISIIINVSERKAAEQRLKESEANLMAANKTKDKFFSIIAHDLRNPLGSLLNLTSMFASDYNEMDDSEKIESIEYLQSASKTAFDLLENLLNWSRTQTGRMDIEKNIIDINQVIENNIELVMPLAEAKTINLISVIPNNMQAFADENMVSTVVRNLLTNAVKFTGYNGNITVTAKNKDNNYCLVQVEDNGVGISEENLEKLFKIDANFKTLGTSREKGTGLGLILCKEFVSLNGGELWVESELGKGSKFKFTLPVKDV